MDRTWSVRIITGILLLSMCSLLLPPTSVSADDVEWPDFDGIDGKIEGFILPLQGGPMVSGGPEGGSDTYLHFNCHYWDGVDKDWRSIKLRISYYPDPTSVAPGGMLEIVERNSFYGTGRKLGESGINWLNEMETKPEFTLIQLENAGPACFSCIYVYKPKELTIPWIGRRVLSYKDNYLVTIEGEGRGLGWHDSREFLDAFDTVERYAINAIDGLGGSLTVVHYDPFSTSSGRDFTDGNLVVATLKDKYDKPIRGETVYFFKEKASDSNKLFNLPVATKQGTDLYMLFPQAFSDVSIIPRHQSYGETDKNGITEINIVRSWLLDWDTLINFRPSAEKPMLEATVYGVVFDKDPTVSYPAGKQPVIKYMDEITIALGGVAAIISRGMVDSTKDSVIKVGSPGQEKEVLKLPYYLHDEDIFFDSNTLLTVKWFNGLAMTFKIKQGFKEGGTIHISYKDAGWYQWFDQTFGHWVVETILGGSALGLGIYLTALGETAAGAFVGGPVVAFGIVGVILVYEGLQSRCDPVLVEPHSKILIDCEEEISVYTVEGMAKLYKVDSGEMVEVSTGQSLRISPSGDFGTVTKFQESDLNEDLHLINESMPTNETAGNSSSSGSFGSIGIIIGIAVAVVLLGGVSFGLNRRRRH